MLIMWSHKQDTWKETAQASGQNFLEEGHGATDECEQTVMLDTTVRRWADLAQEDAVGTESVANL